MFTLFTFAMLSVSAVKKLFHTFFIPWTNVCTYFLIYVGALLTPIVAKPFLKDSEVESTLIGNGTMFDVTELELENNGFWTIKSLYPLIFMIMVLPVPGFIFYFIQVVFNVIYASVITLSPTGFLNIYESRWVGGFWCLEHLNQYHSDFFYFQFLYYRNRKNHKIWEYE